MKKFTVLTSLSLAAMLLLSGCGSNGGQQTTSPDATPGQAVNESEAEQASSKDNLTFVITSEPAAIGPECGNNIARMATVQVYDTLLQESTEDRTVILPYLAESYAFEDEGKKIVFKIKENVKFHNGDLLTTEDVAFSLNLSIATPVNSSMSSMMDRAEVIDDSHVALYLKYAYKPVVNCLAQPGFCIINKAYYEQCQADGTNFSRKPMGTGAYQFVNWVSGEKVVFERFEDFHGEPAKIKNLTLLVMSDATTAALSIENGEVDAFLGVSTADKARLLNNPKVQVMQAGSAGHYVLTFNTRIAPYNDIKFRQAVALGINQEEVLLGGLDGDGWVITAPITLGYFGYPEGFEDNPYDPEKAKELLKEAGYEGQKVVLKTSTESWYSIPAQVIQEQLRKIGLDCELQIMERGAYDAEVTGNMDFEMTYWMTSGAYPDADTVIYRRFKSDQVGGSNNIAGVNDARVDQLIMDARASMDDQERIDLYREICEINKENVWYIPVLTSSNSVVVTDQVAGAYAHSAGLYRLSTWSFK